MKIAICGYGNLGRGVECAVTAAKDMELFAVFTKRDPASVKVATDVPVYNIDDILKYKDDIDVLVICAGSATDLPVMTPSLAKDFCVIDRQNIVHPAMLPYIQLLQAYLHDTRQE
ncbi:MAG: hypothetical protein IIW86_02980 [Clostridia bacterium]|nr:hypothetical protein [Clostridia bacterium]